VEGTIGCKLKLQGRKTMSTILTFGDRMDEQELQESERRRQFIERMEQKLRLKESAYRDQHVRFSKLKNMGFLGIFNFSR